MSGPLHQDPVMWGQLYTLNCQELHSGHSKKHHYISFSSSPSSSEDGINNKSPPRPICNTTLLETDLANTENPFQAMTSGHPHQSFVPSKAHAESEITRCAEHAPWRGKGGL